MARALAKGCYFDFTLVLFNPSFSCACQCLHHLLCLNQIPSRPWLLLQSCKSQRLVPSDQGCASWSLSSHPGLRAHIFNMENPLEGLMHTWIQTQLNYMNFLQHSFDIYLFPKSRTNVPNVPPYLCVWDQVSKYLRDFLSCVAQRSLPTAPRWPSTEQRHELSVPNKWLFFLSQWRHQERCSCLRLVASQNFPMPDHRQLIFPL